MFGGLVVWERFFGNWSKNPSSAQIRFHLSQTNEFLFLPTISRTLQPEQVDGSFEPTEDSYVLVKLFKWAIGLRINILS